MRKTIEAQVRGFLWNRKHEYAVLIVNALDLDHMPRPLDQVLAHALRAEPTNDAMPGPRA